MLTPRQMTWVLAFSIAVMFCSKAHAACSWTTLTNGTIANADQVMSNFDCLAPLDSPTITGHATISSSSGIALGINAGSGFSILADGTYTSFLDPTGSRGITLVTTSSVSKIFGDYLTGSVANPLQLGTWPNETAITIVSSGYVGIGQTAPSQILDVAGTIRQSGCTTAGTLAVNASGDIICSSDARLKNVIGPFRGGLDAIAIIKPVLFTYKSTANNPNESFVHAGFIAQDVKAVIPQASALQRDGYYSLDTTAILAAAVNAIKELRAENINLSKQLAGFQRTSDKQTQEMHLLKTKLSAWDAHDIARLRSPSIAASQKTAVPQE